MQTIQVMKDQEVIECPLLLFDCELASGVIERWSTHTITLNGNQYLGRVLKHNLFEFSAGSEDGIDALSKISVTLANADSRFSEIETATGFRGAKLTVAFVFFDLKNGIAASETKVIFLGTANPPDEIAESTFRLSFQNRMSMQRSMLPEVRIQRLCPWGFPTTSDQRTKAVNGGTEGRFSPFYRCGYSPDISGGAGILNNGAPFTSCDQSRGQCEARGMFSGSACRFGGIEYLPPTINVRTYGDKSWHASAAVENEANYNDYVPVVYGTAWYEPPVIFAQNDGNLTRMQILLGMGEMEGILKVLVRDIEIPQGVAGTDMTATGWFNVISYGQRTGAIDPDFPDSDPYGSMAVLSVVAPNQISTGTTLPRIQVLAQGIKLDTFGMDGTPQGTVFSNNPAWILLDVLRRTGWTLDEIDLSSFAQSAAHCAELISGTDVYGNPVQMPRYGCNVVLRKRRSGGDIARGIRNSAALYLTYGTNGTLQLLVETTIAKQQPTQPDTTNSTQALNGGWPAYEFGDGSSGFSGILRKSNGDPSIRILSRSCAETPNCYTIEFQDEFNEYQQDSFSLVDFDDYLRTGQQITTSLSALGIPNFNQAARLTQLQLERSIQGNRFVELETSVKGVGLRTGDIITVTYLKEGFVRQPFRIVTIAPGVNYRTVLITAQWHDDAWYADDTTESGSGRRQAGGVVGMPRPLAGGFTMTENATEGADGSTSLSLSVAFQAPATPGNGGPGIPLVALAPTVATTGGSTAGGQVFYYAVSALDANAIESALSFTVPAAIPAGTSTNTVTLTGLSFPSEAKAFHVYRGKNPSQLCRVASNQALASIFLDNGLADGTIGPPDPNFDHANFYWRMQLQPANSADVYSENTIGNHALSMLPNDFRGAIARITSGTGAGQERSVSSNDGTALTVAPPWSITPDSASSFTVSDSSWQFGAMATSGSVEFGIPNREGATIEISGRAANVLDVECAYSLSPLATWRIGGAGGLDADVPPEPTFGLYSAGRGWVELGGIAFESLTNTRTVTAATLNVYCWDELTAPSTAALAVALAAGDTTIQSTTPLPVGVNDMLQIDAEVMQVRQVVTTGTVFQVTRAMYETQAAGHAAQTATIYPLARKTFIVPFPQDFFGSAAAGSFSYTFQLPNVRIGAADLFVTNGHGNSPTACRGLTNLTENGLRTFSGGQLSLQVNGYLAIEKDATPPLIVQEACSVRDIFASVAEAPTAAPIQLQINQDGQPYCALTIPAGETMSDTVHGFGLPPLGEKAEIGLDIVSVTQTANTGPGRDLTVTIRL